MKALIVVVVIATVASMSWAADSAGASGRVADPLVAAHDTDGNGKIDLNERKGYVRERARLIREEAKREAALHPVVPPEVRLFLSPPQWTRQKLDQYDANRNGRLELEERAQERRDAVKAAEVKFRKADGNGDGRLDAKERQAALRLQAEDTGP